MKNGLLSDENNNGGIKACKHPSKPTHKTSHTKGTDVDYKWNTHRPRLQVPNATESG